MRYLFPGVFVFSMFWIQGCGNLSGNDLPPGVPDPAIIKTEAAARGMAVTAHRVFQIALVEAIVSGGLLSDELEASLRGGAETSIWRAFQEILIDARQIENSSSEGSPAYDALHEVRGSASQAIGALAAYAPNTSANLRGALYTYAAYAELLLADLFCSGVPLSTLDFGGDWTLRPGSTTREVYMHAIALFDSALTLAADSVPVIRFAQIGKARALLALGEYRQIDTVLKDVPDDFLHVESIVTCDATGGGCLATGDAAKLSFFAEKVTVSNNEGGRTIINPSNPRTLATLMTIPPSSQTPYYYPVYHPTQYARKGVSAVVVASGREAELMRAEAALYNDAPATWLRILNDLRANDPRTMMLPPIQDPGTLAERIDTLFAERAQWLFLTAHRQGDLRRLVRNYNRPQQTVYPTGPYPGGIANYGAFVNLPIGRGEESNPYFRGCLDRRA